MLLLLPRRAVVSRDALSTTTPAAAATHVKKRKKNLLSGLAVSGFFGDDLGVQVCVHRESHAQFAMPLDEAFPGSDQAQNTGKESLQH